MSEKLKTFTIYDTGDLVINDRGKITIAINVNDEVYQLRDEQRDENIYISKNQLIKLFNLDLEVEDED